MVAEENSDIEAVLYEVQGGDTLGAIIKKYYRTTSPQQRKDIISQILSQNPKIKNKDLIYPGQIIVMDIPRQFSVAPVFPPHPTVHADEEVIETLKENFEKARPPERQLMSALVPISLGSGVSSVEMVKHTFKSNTSLLADMAENYNDYKAKKLKKGRYDYQRRTLVGKLKTNLGPLNYLLNGRRAPGEVLRISRKKGTEPTAIIKQKVNRMAKISRFATRGGYVLAGVGLGVACYEIANTEDSQQKNEILVESLGGVAGGILYGAVVTVLIVGTPVGWMAALVIGVTGAVTSFTAGNIAGHIYSVSGTKIDFVNDLGINRICN